MMNNQQAVPVKLKARVSILERLIPAISFGIAAISGIVGALLIRRMFAEFRVNENVGLSTVYIETAKIEAVVGAVLAVALFFGFVGVIVSAARMFTTNKKASPPGLLVPVAGFFGLLPPALVAAGMWIIIYALNNPETGNLGEKGAMVGSLMLGAVGAGIVAILILLVFAFVPFNARTGRKYSPIIFLLVVEGGILVLAGLFFWALYTTAQLLGPDLLNTL
ncbi:MAG TPA: hypothetical protein VK612_07800 [Pyrinomonadaceae bacterium]|nr:hypothetical protein [Pyrinomonadaceae bacterium]